MRLQWRNIEHQGRGDLNLKLRKYNWSESLNYSRIRANKAGYEAVPNLALGQLVNLKGRKFSLGRTCSLNVK